MININKYIEEHQIFDKAILILFYASIFLLPTNLFLVWRIPEAYIYGHFIDYLAPKLYLQQLIIWLLFLVWGTKHWIVSRGKPLERRNSVYSSDSIPLSLLGIVIVSGVSLAISLLRQDWGLASLLTNLLSGPVLLGIFLWKESDFREKHLFPAAILGLTFQAGLALWQWYSQTSLAGYWFLGEPNLRLPEIVTSSLPGALRKLPYGTTPHPNILAGWLALGVSWIYAELRSRRQFTRVQLGGFLFAGLLFLWALLLTESWTAWASVGILVIFVWVCPMLSAQLSRVFTKNSAKVLLLTVFILFQTLGVFLPQFLVQSGSSYPGVASTSLTRRSDLQSQSFVLIQKNPLGSGFRQMFQGIFTSEHTYEGARFIQPAHNTLILFALSLGFWTIIVLLFFVHLEQNKYSLLSLVLLTSLPLFTLDHYLFSTLSGQFMFLFYILFFYKILSKNSPIK